MTKTDKPWEFEHKTEVEEWLESRNCANDISAKQHGLANVDYLRNDRKLCKTTRLVKTTSTRKTKMLM